jgi:penicillin-binding protein 2
VQIAALPGFSLSTFEQRIYDPSASSLSHLLGYVGGISAAELAEPALADYRLVDQVGKAGLERGAESLLRGQNGKVQIEVDALGQELAIVNRTEPTPGANLTLSIDLGLQQFIQRRLEEVLRANQRSRAAVVAIDPRTGGVRALVSLPAYDSNQFATGIDAAAYAKLIADPDKPLFDRAIAGQFPAGSTFKPFVAYAALKEGVVTETTAFLSVGGIRVGPWFFPDWRAGGHGLTDVRKALADSVNTYFYIVGGGYEQTTGLGVERITAYARKFGFGETTGLPLPGEASGFLPSKQWKEETKGERWYVGDTYNLSIGQGDLLVTPIQMAAAAAALANGGTKVTPRLIEAVDGSAATDILETTAETESLDPYVVQVVREGMRQAVTRGSARLLSGLGFPVAGKTGTAQNIGDRPTHAWFIGFAPYQNPTLAVAILIEEGGEGSSVAVPLAYDIFNWWQTLEP